MNFTAHRQAKHLNNIIEADHGKLKRLIKTTLGVQIYEISLCATIKGFEVMRALKKRQADAWKLQEGVKGEVRLVERAFGIGDSPLQL